MKPIVCIIKNTIQDQREIGLEHMHHFPKSWETVSTRRITKKKKSQTTLEQLLSTSWKTGIERTTTRRMTADSSNRSCSIFQTTSWNTITNIHGIHVAKRVKCYTPNTRNLPPFKASMRLSLPTHGRSRQKECGIFCKYRGQEEGSLTDPPGKPEKRDRAGEKAKENRKEHPATPLGPVRRHRARLLIGPWKSKSRVRAIHSVIPLYDERAFPTSPQEQEAAIKAPRLPSPQGPRRR